MKHSACFGIVVLSIVLASCEDSHSSEPPPTTQGGVKCDKWEDTLAVDQWQRKVYRIREGCSGMANSLNVSIELESSPGKRTEVFAFEDGSWNAKYTEQAFVPTVVWVDKNKLSISIGVVGAVYKKIDRVGNIEIAYRIDHVIAEERQSSQSKQ